MTETDLKKPSETDWARIDQITDEEIDTSDSPPLDDAFFCGSTVAHAREENRGHYER